MIFIQENDFENVVYKNANLFVSASKALNVLYNLVNIIRQHWFR